MTTSANNQALHHLPHNLLKILCSFTNVFAPQQSCIRQQSIGKTLLFSKPADRAEARKRGWLQLHWCRLHLSGVCRAGSSWKPLLIPAPGGLQELQRVSTFPTLPGQCKMSKPKFCLRGRGVSANLKQSLLFHPNVGKQNWSVPNMQFCKGEVTGIDSNSVYFCHSAVWVHQGYVFRTCIPK